MTNSNINIEESDIESIAKLIFNNKPQKLGRYELFPNEKDPEIMFQILLTLFLEGILIRNNNLDNLDLTNLDTDILYNKLIELDDWFRSISYDLFIDINENTTDNNHYCKIILKTLDNIYFTLKNIDKLYTFIINGDNYKKLISLDEYKALLIINNKRYNIWFHKKT